MMIKAYKKMIDETLAKYFDEILADENLKYTKKTSEAMKYTACIGGKRLRGILCLESCKIFSDEYYAAIPAACALEMLHAQSLIHDDLPSMDNDDMRRGKPSNHKVYGEACAILAGDALISLGAQTIIDKTPRSVPKENILKAVEEYMKAAGIYGIVGGQTADIEAEKLDGDTDDELLEYIQKYKTGALFKASCLIGGILGGGSGYKLNALEKFSNAFGLAFQMADDILDVVSTPEIMGKTTGKDEYENKLTYVKKFGLNGAKEKLNSQIEKIYDILKVEEIESDVFIEIVDSISNKIF